LNIVYLWSISTNLIHSLIQGRKFQNTKFSRFVNQLLNAKGDFMLKKLIGRSCGILLGTSLLTGIAFAENNNGNNGANCRDLPSYSTLRTALESAQSSANGGFGLEMWGTIVNRDGEVCAVAFTGHDRGDQWPGSRVISAQKANTANAFSLPGLSLSTANLYTAVQPGGSLFGLQESNPVDVSVAYGGNSSNYGQSNDPMVGGKIGGVNVFGGGLALYKSDGHGHVTLVGAIGVSGDTSCADHEIAWRTRNNLHLDFVPGGVSGDTKRPDNIVYDITSQVGQMPGLSTNGWGHPTCVNTVDPGDLPPTSH
jgi:uncharacterized protein GlcG (DUF336 family)